MATGVYQILNTVSGKRYIGSAAVSFRKRWTDHLSSLRLDRKKNPYLQNAWNKHGEKAFIFEILEECLPKDCIEREQYYMDFMKPEYNLYPTAGSSLGTHRTKETRLKISKAMMGVPKTKEMRERLSIARTGIPLTEEHCCKMKAWWTPERRQARSKAMMGNTNALGHKITEETKQKMSEAQRIPHSFAEDGTELVRCGKCKKYHPLTAFGKDKSRWDGLNKSCRDSVNQYEREKYKKKNEVKN